MTLEECLYAIRNLVSDQAGEIKTLKDLNQQLRGRNEGLCKRVEELEREKGLGPSKASSEEGSSARQAVLEVRDPNSGTGASAALDTVG